MEVILHIGTHKTGSSSVQFFCARNRDRLREHRIYYAINENKSGKNANFVGGNIFKGKHEAVREFIETAVDEATRSGLDRILISGETIYAMNTFYPAFGSGAGGKYWELEANCVGKLAELLHPHDVKIVCYLRRQDLFAESMYSEMLRSANGYAGSVDDFLGETACLFDYYRHLDIWARFFGDAAIRVRAFDPKANIISDFVSFALGIEDVSDWSIFDAKVGVRASYDVLAFKRDLNKQDMSPVRRTFVHRALEKFSVDFPNPRYTWLPRERREALLDGHREGNAMIVNRWLSGCGPLFGPMGSEGEDLLLYPGLSEDRRKEIAKAFGRAMNNPKMLAKIWLRSLLWEVELHLPIVGIITQPLRRYVRQRRLARWVGNT